MICNTKCTIGNCLSSPMFPTSKMVASKLFPHPYTWNTETAESEKESVLSTTAQAKHCDQWIQSPPNFLTRLVGEPCIMCIFTSSSSTSPYCKGFTRRKSNRHIQKNWQNDQGFSKHWFIHKRFQEDQLRSSQNYNRCRAIPILSQHSFSNTHKQN